MYAVLFSGEEINYVKAVIAFQHNLPLIAQFDNNSSSNVCNFDFLFEPHKFKSFNMLNLFVSSLERKQNTNIGDRLNASGIKDLHYVPFSQNHE